MLNFFDRISIALNDVVQTIDYKIELNRPTYEATTRVNREAGESNDSRATSSVNTSVSNNSQQSKPSIKDLPLIMREKICPESTNTEPETLGSKPKSEDKPNNDAAVGNTPEESKAVEQKVEPKSNAKKTAEDEEQLMAEAQAPEEEPGAEVISVNEAASSSGRNPNNNINIFGIDIDIDAMTTHNAPAPTVWPQQTMQPRPTPSQQQWWATSYQHRSDMKQPNNTPKPAKAGADQVNLSIPDLTEGGINHPPVKQVVEAIPGPLTQPAPVPTPAPVIDNRTMIAKYNYLGEIEKIALETGANLQFTERPDYLIEVRVFVGHHPAADKGFTIDPGYIIDRRVKVFPGILPYFEGYQAYPLFVMKNNERSINTDLIKGLIVGGNQYPREDTGMYRRKYIDLNSQVDLSSIPTNKVGKEDRKLIQNRLVAAFDKNVFAPYLTTGTRFRVTNFDPKTKEIIVSTGATLHHGAPAPSIHPVSLRIKEGGKAEADKG